MLSNIATSGKLLSIDYGQKNIGLAVSDATQTLSFAKKVIKKDENLLSELRLFISSEKITAGIIVGKPLTNNQDLDIDDFCLKLNKEFKLPVITSNEDFSTFEAFEKMDQTNLSKQEKQELKDAFAAQVILEKYLLLPQQNGSRNGN